MSGIYGAYAGEAEPGSARSWPWRVDLLLHPRMSANAPAPETALAGGSSSTHVDSVVFRRAP